MAYRSRSRNDNGRTRIWYGPEDKPIDQLMPKCINVNLWSDSTYFTYGDSYSSSRSIVDDPTTSSRRYKYVSHFKSEAAWVAPRLTYQMSHPWPPLAVRMHMPIVIGPSAFSGGETYDWSAALEKLAAKVDSAIDSNFQGAVFLKELRESVTMIRNPFRLFSRSQIKRKLLLKQGQHFPDLDLNKASSHRLGKEPKLTDFWLEYRYGWRLLLADVENFAKALVSANASGTLQKGVDNWMRFSAKAEVNSIPSTDLSRVYLVGSQSLFNAAATAAEPWRTAISGAPGYIYLDRSDHEYFGLVTLEQLRPFHSTANLFNKILGVLSMSNWRQVRDTLWEILPCSFVVDWFINFSDIWRPFSEDRLSRLDLRRVGYSVKKSYSFTPHIALTKPNYRVSCGFPYDRSDCVIMAQNGGRGDIAGSKGYVQSYRRTPGFPSGSSGIFGQAGLSLFQTLDMASIIRQMRHK